MTLRARVQPPPCARPRRCREVTHALMADDDDASGSPIPSRLDRHVAGREALLLHVRGVVQGVGFRPFVHRLADRLALSGWVRNEAGEVRIHIEGEPDAVHQFLVELRADAPSLARIRKH